MIVCEIVVRNIGISDYTIAEDEDIKINKFYCIFVALSILRLKFTEVLLYLNPRLTQLIYMTLC